jgi:hypothetical protein
MGKAEVSINNETLNLVELCQVSHVQCLISEHSINREELSWSEIFILGDLIKSSRRYCSSVCSENILQTLFVVPLIVISNTAISSFLMDISDFLPVLLVRDLSFGRIDYEESIVGISGGMGLRLEQAIEVPECTLNISVCLHFFESQLKQDLSELGSCLHQRMQVSIFEL